jgi:hypothetical protein
MVAKISLISRSVVSGFIKQNRMPVSNSSHGFHMARLIAIGADMVLQER